MRRPYIDAMVGIPYIQPGAAGGTISPVQLNAGTEYSGCVLRVPPNLNGKVLKSFSFYVTAKAAGDQTVTGSCETVTAIYPTGSAYGGSASGNVTVTASGQSFTVTLGTGATLTAGEIFALKLSTSGDVTVSNRATGWFPPQADNYSYTVLNTGSDSSSAGNPIFALYDDGGNILDFPSVIHGCELSSAVNLATSGSTYGVMGFTMPFTARAIGLIAVADLNNSNDAFGISKNGISLTESVFSDITAGRRATGISGNWIALTPVLLKEGETYQAYMKAGNTTNSTLNYFRFATESLKNVNKCLGGVSAKYFTGATLDALTEDVQRVPMMQVICDRIYPPAPLIGSL